MTDGGSHFNNGEVKGWCVANSTEHRVTAAYAPWVNGLVENANGLLLGRLRRLCNGEAGGEDNSGPLPPDVDRNWPDHFDTAVRQLNERIIPSLRFSPKELLLGYVVNTVRTPATTLDKEPGPADSDVHLAYADQQRLDATDRATLHATQRKAVFDRSVLSSSTGEVIFTHDQLVQVHESARETTLSTSRKLRPQWSAPRRVKERVGNSYKLTTLEGFPMPGLFHARRLRLFIPRAGSPLADCESARTEGQHTTEDSTNEEEEGGPGAAWGYGDDEANEMSEAEVGESEALGSLSTGSATPERRTRGGGTCGSAGGSGDEAQGQEGERSQSGESAGAEGAERRGHE